jgi:hypothetical protein
MSELTLERLTEMMAKLPPPVLETTIRCGSGIYNAILETCVPSQGVVGKLSAMTIEHDPLMSPMRAEMGYYRKGEWVATKVYSDAPADDSPQAE